MFGYPCSDRCWPVAGVAGGQGRKVRGGATGGAVAFRAVILGLCLSLALVCAVPAARAGIPGFLRARMGVLRGVIQLPPGVEMPADGAIVAFFDRRKGPPPTEVGMHRVPEMVVRSSPEGRFGVSLLPGSYMIGVLLRPRGVGPGPPRPGEQFFFAMTPDGRFATFAVQSKATTDAGVIAVAPPQQIRELTEFVTVRGRVFDEQGRPFAGARILVKQDPRMARPLFVSAPSAADGSYAIKLPPDTTYYIVARQNIQGGRPAPGSYVGTFGKRSPEPSPGEKGAGPLAGVGPGGVGEALPVRGAAGEVIDHVDITMFRVPDPEANRRKYKKEERAPEDGQGRGPLRGR